MKEFFKNLFSSTGIKAFSIWGCVVVLVFVIGWSIYDGKLNIWPLVFVGAILLLIIGVSWLMRNNE